MLESYTAEYNANSEYSVLNNLFKYSKIKVYNLHLLGRDRDISYELASEGVNCWLPSFSGNFYYRSDKNQTPDSRINSKFVTLPSECTITFSDIKHLYVPLIIPVGDFNPATGSATVEFYAHLGDVESSVTPTAATGTLFATHTFTAANPI